MCHEAVASLREKVAWIGKVFADWLAVNFNDGLFFPNTCLSFCVRKATGMTEGARIEGVKC